MDDETARTNFSFGPFHKSKGQKRQNGGDVSRMQEEFYTLFDRQKRTKICRIFSTPSVCKKGGRADARRMCHGGKARHLFCDGDHAVALLGPDMIGMSDDFEPFAEVVARQGARENIIHIETAGEA